MRSIAVLPTTQPFSFVFPLSFSSLGIAHLFASLPAAISTSQFDAIVIVDDDGICVVIVRRPPTAHIVHFHIVVRLLAYTVLRCQLYEVSTAQLELVVWG